MRVRQDQVEDGDDVESMDRWRDALASVDVDDVLELAHIVAEAPTHGLGAKLGGVVDGTVEAGLAGADVEPLLTLVSEGLGRAMTEPGGTLASVRGRLAAAVLLAAVDPTPTGAATPDDVAADVADRVQEALALPDADRHDLAIGCLALRRDELAMLLVGGSSPSFEPGLSFGPDKQSFVRYLVAAAQQQAPVRDLTPAWTSFVLDHPAAVEAGSVRWSSLLHAGYAVYVRFAGRAPEQVMSSIKQFVDEALRMG